MSLSFRPLMSVAIIIVIIAACAFFSWWSARRHRPFRTSDLVRRGAITCALLSILIGPSIPGEAQKVTTNVEVWLATGPVRWPPRTGKAERLVFKA